MKIRNLMLALAGTALVFSACEKDPNPKVPTTDANIALATILPNPDGMTGAAYLQLIRDEFPQNTNNNNGIPIPYGGSYPIIEGNDIFVFPGYMGDRSHYHDTARRDRPDFIRSIRQQSGSIRHVTARRTPIRRPQPDGGWMDSPTGSPVQRHCHH